MALTKKQLFLVREIEKFMILFGLDYEAIEDYKPIYRTSLLENIKRKIIRGQIILFYTIIDEHLSEQVCYYFFGHKRTFPQLWKTKRFQQFNYYILEDISLMQKLRFVKSIASLPKSVLQDIERLNALRNGFAHAFFPENLRKSKPFWKGKDVFSLEGAELFHNDFEKLCDYFLHSTE